MHNIINKDKIVVVSSLGFAQGAVVDLNPVFPVTGISKKNATDIL